MAADGALALPAEREDEQALADGDALADRTAEQVFGGEDNARRTAELIERFVASWERHKHEKSPTEWLREEFQRHPDLWATETDLVSTADEVVAGVEQANEAKASLQNHLEQGKSKASWLASSIERGAAAAGASNVGEYAHRIDEALKNANAGMLETLTTQSGAMNMAPNLDGFIAERHHVNTFNLDAAAKGSPLRAEALGGQGKNSVDIVVKDANDKVVRRYQSKYGQDADATQALFDKGDYRGQRKLVPSGQEGDIPGSTARIEVDGVRSTEIPKEEVKRLQEQAQLEREFRDYKWNDVNRIEVGKMIGKQALYGAAIACAFEGASFLGRRLWNSFTGERNRPLSEDMEAFFKSSIKSGARVGAQTAVTGAVVVAARNGWIKVLQRTPAGTIAGIVHVGIENAKVLYKLATGELTADQALDAMGTTTASAVGGLVGAGKGAAVGSIFGPVGTIVGGVVGGIAGSKIGEAVWEASKVIVKTAVSVVEDVVEGVMEAGKIVLKALNPVNWFA